MQTKPKPVIYSNLTSSKLMHPKTFVRPSGQQNVWTSELSRSNVLPNDLKYFRLPEKRMQKGSTQNIIINPVRNGQVSDYSFANFRRLAEEKVLTLNPQLSSTAKPDCTPLLGMLVFRYSPSASWRTFACLKTALHY